MKATKFLPLALVALMLTPAAFAEPSSSATTTMSLTVSPFIDIKVNNATFTSATTVDDEFTQLTITTPPNPIFSVINNQFGRKIALSATCVTDGTPAPALGGTTSSPVLAFSNNTTTRKASATDVSDALSESSSIANNKNVIAFSFTPVITPSEGASAQPTAALADNQITYTINNGKYSFSYTATNTNKAGTFSTHDENGDYKCTLTMTANAAI